jgi:hypothetical protein
MKQLLAIVAVLALMVGVKAVPPASLTTEGSSALSTFLGDAVARGDVPALWRWSSIATRSSITRPSAR